MNQEMMNLVDNLVDTDSQSQFGSPSSRIDGHSDKNQQFHLKVKATPEPDTFGGMVSSVGILKYDSGNIYEGQLLNGQRSGKGKMTFANGDKYLGMWKQDQMCDNDGIYSFKNGNEYRGDFKTTFANKYGVFEGQGQLKISGVGTFVGQFSSGNANGPGKFEYCDGQKTFEGTWTNTKIEDLIK